MALGGHVELRTCAGLCWKCATGSYSRPVEEASEPSIAYTPVVARKEHCHADNNNEAELKPRIERQRRKQDLQKAHQRKMRQVAPVGCIREVALPRVMLVGES